jgi:IS30 family transposase
MGHKQLNREKREIIERLLEKRHSIREIALILGYSPSGICQEIRRNSEYQNGMLVYHHQIAQRKTAYRRKRPGNTCKSDILVRYVVDKLRLYWSPEQIEGRLVLDYPSQPNLRVSFKTIYRWIERSKQHRSPLGCKARYTKYLRFKRQRKYVRNGTTKRAGRRTLPCISNRPEQAVKKIEFGHWEGDLVLGYRGVENAVTMVEMSTGFLVATLCKDKRKDTVSKAITSAFNNVQCNAIKTIALDRGSEFSAYEEVQNELGCKVYFCHPQMPTERALNEQTNGLLRQFYPKRKRSVFSDPDRLAWAVNLINNRPRKKFGYRTTWEIINDLGLAGVFSLV